jgi:hypothetical protein
MTLIPFTPDRLDSLALRLLDLSSALRGMSKRCRAEGLEHFNLHDKKAAEWLARLEHWTDEALIRFDSAVHRHRGAQLARQLTSSRRKKKAPRHRAGKVNLDRGAAPDDRA